MPSSSLVLSSALVALVSLVDRTSLVSADVYGPGALNNLIHYVVEAEPSFFRCESVGSRCTFQRSDFTVDPDFGGAQDFIQIGIFCNDVGNGITIGRVFIDGIRLIADRWSDVVFFANHGDGINSRSRIVAKPYILTVKKELAGSNGLS